VTGRPEPGLRFGAARSDAPVDALAVEVLARPVTGLALRAGAVPIVDGIRLRNVGTERVVQAVWFATIATGAPATAGAPALSSEGPNATSGGAAASVPVPVLHPGEEVLVAGPPSLQLPVEQLVATRQVEPATLHWRLACGDQELGRGEVGLDVLPWDGWPADRGPAAVLAGFVLPDDPVVATLARRMGGSAAEAVASRLVGLHAGIRALALKIAEVPPGWEQRGMRLRLPDTILRGQRANSFELALLYAGCLERMGLAALLVSTGDRLLVGAWVIDERFREGTVLEAGRLRAARAAHQLLLLDPAGDGMADPTVRPAAVFDAAGQLDDRAFRFAIDLRAARADGWQPLPARPPPDLRSDGSVRPVVAEVLVEAARAPAEPIAVPRPRAPVAEPDEPVAARFRQWKDRLLDLSLRNRLLAYRIGARTSVPLDVPDLGRFTERLLGDAAIEVVPGEDPDRVGLGDDGDPTEYGGSMLRTLEAAAEDWPVTATTRTLPRSLRDDEATAATRTLPFARDGGDGAGPSDLGFADEPTDDMPERTTLRGQSADLDGLEEVDPEHLRKMTLLDQGRVHALLDAPMLLAHAVALDRATRVDLEEGGVNTLYAAVGFLRWSEAGSAAEPSRLAPLLLIPVVLELHRSAGRVRIRRAPDDPIANVTLVEKIRRDFDIDLGAITSMASEDGAVDVNGLIAAATEAIAPMPRWRVEPRVALGQLLFTKFLLWRDLEDNARWLLESRVVQHIARRAGSPYPNTVEPTPTAVLDDRVGPEVLPLVVDADSTQMAAIHSALRGRSFVLQGPPGTGKSQTITNLVAAAIASGRTVLVVAEKLAALDVVHRRLLESGLGHACLELHSHKANKRQVAGALAAALRREPGAVAPQWEARSAELGESRQRLNAYVRALHAPRPLGASFHDVSSRILHDRTGSVVEVGGPSPEDLTEDLFRATIEQAARFATAAAEVEPVAEHPWADTRITRWSAASEQTLLARLSKAVEATEDVAARASELAELIGVPAPASGARMRDLVDLAASLVQGPLPPAATDPAKAPRFAARVLDFADRYGTWQARSRAVSQRWHPAIYRTDLARLVAKFGSWAHSWFVTAYVMLFFSRRELRSHARRELPDNRTIAADLAVALQVEEAREALGAERKALLADSAGTWSGTDTDELKSLTERADALRERVRRVRLGGGGDVSGAVLSWVDPALPADRRKVLQRKTTEATRALERWISAVDTLCEAVGAAPLQVPRVGGPHPRPPPRQGAPRQGQRAAQEAEARPFAAIRERLARWSQGSSRYRSWAMYGEAAEAMDEVGLEAVVQAHREGAFPAGQVVAVTERSVLSQWLEEVRDEEDALRAFSGPEHHRQVLRFRQLDRQHLDLGIRQVCWFLDQRLPRISGEVADSSEPGIVLREAAKKTRHKSVRRLFQEIPNLLARLKPCLLMSPMSVAQYLPAGGRRFDLVVFDEASQIGTHDAIGALARGAQVVVVGDSRQLPPTTFFQRAGGDEIPDDNDYDELESILDEAVASGLPEQMLGWHYRSRHESLIRFSNDHYYEGRLAVFPAARGRVGDLGLTWHPVPQGVYDKARTRTNRAEATALVGHLVAALQDARPGERTFGVVTFSQAQQALVSDLLDDARRVNPQIEPHFAGIDEPVFVKNLENVQGDERDEILFSIGYGPDERGRIWMNFGPLNRDGGERRLNVAVTRARRQLRVFSTLTHDQIDLARTRARGVHHLKEFLRYAAEAGRVAEADAEAPPTGGRHHSRDFPTAFEQDVYEFLRGRGFRVDVGVGCGEYRIDLAVRHPERPGEYVLGIELDGSAYASAATARDRDRLRPEVLEGLGWRLHRVWSTDWWFDQEREIVRLDRALSDATSGEPWVDDEPTDGGDAEDDELQAVEPSPGDARIEQYVYAQVVNVSDDPKSLYDASLLGALERAVQQVIEVEAPLHVSELTRRVGAAFGQKKLTAKAKRRVTAVAKKLEPPAVLRESFVWRSGEDPARFERVRGASADGITRDAESIPPEEVVCAVKIVLTDNLAMPHGDLVRETARVFGLTRLGRKITEAMTSGIALLIERGGAEVSDDRVVGR
jgi:very-short-patch-repair endonuclease